MEFHRLTAETAPMLATSEVFDSAVDPAQLAAFVDSPLHHMVFACEDGNVTGFASGSVLLHPDKQPTLFVNEVGVAKAFRQRGLATELCQRLFDSARAVGCRGIWLATEADNDAARALYRRLGARETDDIVVYDWDGAMDE